jgi:hypothetical protein
MPGWSSIAAPDFPPASPLTDGVAKSNDTPTQVAVSPGNQPTMYMSSLDGVMRSDDGGCTWKDSLSLKGMSAADIPPTTSAFGQIESLVVPDSAEGASRVYVVVVDLFLGGRRTILGSEDRGSTWKVLFSPMYFPAVSSNTTLMVAPSDPDTMYLFTWSSLVWPNMIYVTEDAGATWEEYVSGINPYTPSESVEDSNSFHPGYAIDPLNPHELWVTSCCQDKRRLLHSTDGGRTWEDVPNLPPRQANESFFELYIHVSHEVGEPAQLAVAAVIASGGTLGTKLWYSESGGDSWETLVLPDVYTHGVMFADGSSSLVIKLTEYPEYGALTPPGRTTSLWRYDYQRRGFVQLLRTGESHDLDIDFQKRPRAYMVTNDSVWVYSGRL